MLSEYAFFSVPYRSHRQILLSLPPILDMLFLLLFVILIFAMLGKLMIMRVIVLLFIQNISKLIVCLHLWCSCLQMKCAFSPAGSIRFFLWKSVSHLSVYSGTATFFEKNYLTTSWRMPSHFLGKLPWRSCAGVFMLFDGQQNLGFKIETNL